jgi:hypothetical protein
MHAAPVSGGNRAYEPSHRRSRSRGLSLAMIKNRNPRYHDGVTPLGGVVGWGGWYHAAGFVRAARCEKLRGNVAAQASLVKHRGHLA